MGVGCPDMSKASRKSPIANLASADETPLIDAKSAARLLKASGVLDSARKNMIFYKVTAHPKPQAKGRLVLKPIR
jgi:hypothetical protein